MVAAVLGVAVAIFLAAIFVGAGLRHRAGNGNRVARVAEKDGGVDLGLVEGHGRGGVGDGMACGPTDRPGDGSVVVYAVVAGYFRRSCDDVDLNRFAFGAVDEMIRVVGEA